MQILLRNCIGFLQALTTQPCREAGVQGLLTAARHEHVQIEDVPRLDLSPATERLDSLSTR